MFWEVKKAELKNSFKFYRFLNEYRQFFKENNTAIDVAGYRDFFAVIDGQQRLTSIYLGIKGSVLVPSSEIQKSIFEAN